VVHEFEMTTDALNRKAGWILIEHANFQKNPSLALFYTVQPVKTIWKSETGDKIILSSFIHYQRKRNQHPGGPFTGLFEYAIQTGSSQMTQRKSVLRELSG
jgi:hypothetical protein